VQTLSIDCSGKDTILTDNGFRDMGEVGENVSEALTKWKLKFD